MTKNVQRILPGNRNELAAIPESDRALTTDLLLELQHTIKKGFSSGRAARDIHINWNDTIAATDNGVRVMVVATSVSARTHRNNPLGFGLKKKRKGKLSEISIG